MRRKLSEFASTRTGLKNSMWKHKYTAEQIKNLSEGQKEEIGIHQRNIYKK